MTTKIDRAVTEIANSALASSYRLTRSWIKFDRFALSDLGREHRLSDRALLALDTLCRLADRRIGVVNTTIHDLTGAICRQGLKPSLHSLSPDYEVVLQVVRFSHRYLLAGSLEVRKARSTYERQSAPREVTT